MDSRERALRHYFGVLALAKMLGLDFAPAPAACDFCGRPLAENERYRHQPCNTIRSMNFGGRL